MPKIEPSTLPYRPCVGIMLINKDGDIFVARRVDTPGAWQMPQGGIDEGESAGVAALRELEEEIGTGKAVLLAESNQWLSYDLPPNLLGKVWGGKYRGQTQKWVACRFTGVDADINLETEHPEFDAWQWVSVEELPRMIVPFKRAIYDAVVQEFRHLAVPA